MRKIDSIVGLDGHERTLSGIEEDYYKALIKWKDPFKSLTNQNVLNAMPKGSSLTRLETKILDTVRNNGEELAKISIRDMQAIINKYGGKYAELFYKDKKATGFSKAIQKVMNYNGFRKAKTKGVWFAKMLNIKACPYCNSQYTLVVESKDAHLAKFQFDHFFPKSRYPFFCLSLYNLVPSCASCNLSKSEKDFNTTDFIHPYDKSLADYFKIQLPQELLQEYLTGNGRLPISDIAIELKKTGGSSYIDKHDKVFNITGIHKRHFDIIQEILIKAKSYSNSAIVELLDLKVIVKDKGKGKNVVKPMFSDKDEIKQMLFGNYLDKEDINNRPLSKLIQDIVSQLELE